MKTTLTFLLASLVCTSAFMAPANKANDMALSMAPKYDKAEGKWFVTSPEEGPEAGYGPGKTLLLAGPKPFLTRLFSPDDYEQAVLKFMAGEKCSREVAQGNLDRYFENAQDWAYERLEAEKKGRPYPAYHVLDQKGLILTLVWSTIVGAFGGRAIYSLATGVYYWSFLYGN